MAVKQLGLTGRELEVVRRLATGCESSEIARELGISDATLRVHLASIATKASRLNANGTQAPANYRDAAGIDEAENAGSEPLARDLAAGVLRRTGLHANRST